MAIDSWDSSAQAVTFSISLGRALLAAMPPPGYVFSFMAANGGATQPAPGIALGPAAGIYAGLPLPVDTLSNNIDTFPLFIKLWAVHQFWQSTARPTTENVFNLTLQPTVDLAIGTVVVVSGVFGVVAQDPTIQPPIWAGAGAQGVNLVYVGQSPASLFGIAAAFDPAAGTLTFTTGSRWLAKVQSTVLFSMMNGLVAQLPTNATIAATAPAGSGPGAPPPVIAAAEPFDAEECERRPFYINSVALLYGPDGDNEDNRFRCIDWNSYLGSLTALVATNQSISGVDSTTSNTNLQNLAAATAFRLPLINSGSAQAARKIILQTSLSPGASTVTRAEDSIGGPMQIRMWQTAAAAQISDIPGVNNAITIALEPEVDLPTGATIALKGLLGTAAFFAESLQVSLEKQAIVDFKDNIIHLEKVRGMECSFASYHMNWGNRQSVYHLHA